MKSPAHLLFLLGCSFTISANGQTLATPPTLAKPATTTAAPAKAQAAPTPAKAQPVAVSVVKPKETAPAPTPVKEEVKHQEPVQETKIQRLISEREQLVLKYDYLKTQENSFWGNASKKDLQAVIDALKEVLQKDTEIIQAVSEQMLEARRAAALKAAELELETKRLNSQVQGDKRLVTDNIYELKASLENARNLVRRREKQIKDLEEKLQLAGDAKFEHDAIAAFFAMLSLVLVGYIVRLKGKLNNRTDAKKQMKKA